MNRTREHLDFEEMNDFVDGYLDDGARSRVAEHLTSCAVCRESVDRLVHVLDRTESLPEAVLPPEDLWHDVRAAIDQRKQLVLPVSAGATAPTRTAAKGNGSGRPWWASRALLAAAAGFLMVGSSAVTAFVIRSMDDNPSGRMAGSIDAPDRLTVLPASFRQTEGEYLRTIQELRAALQAQRSTLRPETIAAVEHSLMIVDAAIDEARTALLSDPGNRTLVDLLTASYERKMDLLRRAADLGA